MNLYKVLMAVLIIVALLEAGYIYATREEMTFTALKSFTWGEGATDGIVTAEGSWVGANADLHFSTSSVKMQCWKGDSACYVSTATLSDQHLYSFLDYLTVTKWTDDSVEAVEKAICAETTYLFDRKSATVTSTRRVISDEGMCGELDKEPLVSFLSDRY